MTVETTVTPEALPEALLGVPGAESTDATVLAGRRQAAARALAARQAQRAAAKAAGLSLVVERRDPIERAERNPRSLRLAITAKCWSCVCGDADPNPRGRIRDCACSKTCPLWPHRPYQRADAETGVQSHV